MIFYTARINFVLLAILFFAVPAAIFAAEGDLDSSFDADGIVITDNGSGGDAVADLAVQPDGKIIALGSSPIDFSSTARTVVVRYNPNGSIDSTFGAGGKVIIQFIIPAKMALQANGKIVVAGKLPLPAVGQSFNGDFYVARLNPDGSFDATFNGNGAITVDLRGGNDSPSSVKVQPDGKIVVGGITGGIERYDYAIVRFNADGSLDQTFDGDGKVFTSVLPEPQSRQESLAEIVIQPDGKIAAAGSAYIYPPDGLPYFDNFIVVRYNADGSLDQTFDGDGKVFTRIGTDNASVNSAALQSDGKILVVGTARTCCSTSQAALIRYNADGSLDSSFGTGGKTLISFTPFSTASAYVKIQAGNKIALALTVRIISESYAGAARLNANGSLDTTFSGDGQNFIFFPTYTTAAASAAAIQPDGKILIGGYVGASSASDFLLARFTDSNCAANCSGVRRPTVADFDGDGKSDVSVFRPSDGYWYISKSSGGYSFLQWGKSGDTLVPGDYDGDGRTDLAINRLDACLCLFQTANTWYILRSSDNTVLSRQFGANGFSYAQPMPADYDGDGKTDFAFYDSSDAIPAPGFFRIVQSATNSAVIRQWGLNVDRKVPADYDGDGRDDLAVFRYFDYPGNTEFGTWFILQSSNGAMRVEYFGLPTDILVPADYDGDGKTDIAVWRPSNGYWYRINSSDKSFTSYQFGLSDDKPVPADYDGDGRTDIAVFRPSTGVWYLQRSTAGFAAQPFGLRGDVPIPNVFVR